MADYSIATLNESKPTFKSPALNKATAIIYDAVSKFNTSAKEARRTVAVTLAKVEKHKDYEKDGFKSLADYAASIGFEKSAAHKLENAGRLMISENETVKALADEMDYSKLAIIASADEKDIEAAVKSGELKADDTQDAVRTWKQNVNAKNAKPKVLPNYTVDFTIYGKSGARVIHYDAIAFEAIPELSGATFANIKSAEGVTYKIAMLPDLTLARIDNMEKVKAVKAVKGMGKATDKMTREELEAVIASLQKKLKERDEDEDGAEDEEE